MHALPHRLDPGVEVIDKIIAGQDVDDNLALLDDLCEVMLDGSLCAMGGMTPFPVRSVIKHFGEDFRPTTASPTGIRAGDAP